MAKRGGSSTVHGVLYQLLWSLLRTSEFRILTSSTVSDDGEACSVTVILEPEGGGGDLQIFSHRAISVEQIKSRGGNRTWPLLEVIEDVLPDLYIAARKPWPKRFRFVTDGRIGNWTDVRLFFRSLSRRNDSGQTTHSALSHDSILRTGVSSSTARLKSLESEHSIFESIVAAVRSKHEISQRESENTTRRKLRKFLPRFRFCEMQSSRAVVRRIDRLLSSCPIATNDVIKTRWAMMARLGELASQGGAIVETDQFFAEFGIGDSFRRWFRYRERASAVLRRRLIHRGYDEQRDVRRSLSGFTARYLTHDRPVTVVHGLSGQGKSWLAFGLARWVADHWPTLAIVISSKGSSDDDLLEAARVFWSEIVNDDSQLPLDRIAAKLRPNVLIDGHPLVLVVVDNVASSEELQRLVQAQWADWNMRLVVTCEDSTLMSPEVLQKAGATAIPASDFLEGELQTYLQQHLGDEWHTISDDVRATLRRPLFADLYVRTFSAGWRPTNEYSLLEARYQSLLANYPHPLDCLFLEKLCEHLVSTGQYPYPIQTMHALGFDEERIRRLMRDGWLRRSKGYFEIGHDRLLNWIVARVLWTKSRDKTDPTTAMQGIITWIQALIRNDGKHGYAQLGYVPIDLLWMLCSEDESGVWPARYLEGLETIGWRYADSLYKEHVATIGPRAVPALFLRLKANKNSQLLRYPICNAISSFPWQEIKVGVVDLLASTDLEERLLAADILTEQPAADVLDKLWNVHSHVVSHPMQVDSTTQRPAGTNCEQDALRRIEAALCECVKLNGNWLVEQIEKGCDTPREWRMISHLAWRAKLSQERWQVVRNKLIANVEDAQVYLLARCIEFARDYQSLPWLKSQLDASNPNTIAAVLDTLAHLAPDDAIVCLRTVRPESLSIFTERFWLSELFARRERETLSTLREMMASHGVWPLAGNLLWYQEWIDDATFEMVLNDLPRLIAEAIAAQDPNSTHHLHSCLVLLGNCRTRSQLTLLGQLAGTDIETKLVALFERIGPRSSLSNDSHVRSPLVRVLQRIGASGFSDVVNRSLSSSTRWGRHDGLALSSVRFDEQTVACLRNVAEMDSRINDHALEQNDAAEHLARWNDWDAVLGTVHRVDGQVFRDLGECGLPPTPWTSDLIQRVCQRVFDDPRQATGGDVRLLGFAQHAEHIHTVMKVLDSVKPESDVAFSCVLALANLNCRDQEAVPLIAKVHEVRANQDATARLLLDIGTVEAMSAVRKGLEADFSPVTALNYLNQCGNDPAIVRWAIAYFRTAWWGSGISYLEVWVRYLNDQSILKEILNVSEIQDNLRREVFRRETQSRPRAIRCLAFIDADAAFLAAEKALRNMRAPDRDSYPSLMMEISREKAIPRLISIFVDDRSVLIRRAIKDALTFNIDGWHLPTEWNSNDWHRRAEVCQLAAACGNPEQIIADVQKCLDDECYEVSGAAVAAIHCLRKRQTASDVINSISSESNQTAKWNLIEMALNLIPIGQEDSPWPDWYLTAFRSFPTAMLPRFRQLIERRRKKQKDDDKSSDWFNHG